MVDQSLTVATSMSRQIWSSRLLWGLVAAFAIYFGAKFADRLWFRTQLPISFYDANWSGTWETKRHFGLSGTLLVRLPEPLPVNEDFKATALVYYPIYSAWRPGQFVKMEFDGRFSPDSLLSAGQTQNSIPGGGGKLSFKGTVGSQVVEYVAIIDRNQTHLVGGYLSASPDDYGCFSISTP